MMTIQTSPTWFTFGIMLQAVSHRPEETTCRKYWTPLISQKAELLAVLNRELTSGYGGFSRSCPEAIARIVVLISKLNDQPLVGQRRDEFSHAAHEGLEAIASELGVKLL